VSSLRRTRLATVEDAPDLFELLRRNRAFLSPWEPARTDDYFTPEGQERVIGDALDLHRQGSCVPHVIVDDQGHLVGRITLNHIIRGPLQSCSVGYWVGEFDNGRGLATEAVGRVVRIAFEQMGLHRVQAETLLRNVASQRVLERNGFMRYGMAPAYLHIAGQWRDTYLYQLVNETSDGSSGRERSSGKAR
jgi:ribosomal-protein-alanine N-acetyltransferase